jgi:acyl-CoA thioesterase FadM
MSHEMTASDPTDGDRLVAEASTILVAYDYESEQAIRVPDTWRDAFAAHEGRSLEKPA